VRTEQDDALPATLDQVVRRRMCSGLVLHRQVISLVEQRLSEHHDRPPKGDVRGVLTGETQRADEVLAEPSPIQSTARPLSPRSRAKPA